MPGIKLREEREAAGYAKRSSIHLVLQLPRLTGYGRHHVNYKREEVYLSACALGSDLIHYGRDLKRKEEERERDRETERDREMLRLKESINLPLH